MKFEVGLKGTGVYGGIHKKIFGAEAYVVCCEGHLWFYNSHIRSTRNEMGTIASGEWIYVVKVGEDA